MNTIPVTLPSEFVARIRGQFAEEADNFLASLEEEPLTSMHLNSQKGLSGFENNEPVSWYEHGRMLPSRPSFTLDPLFHAGLYYPQESSSMFLMEVLKQTCGEMKSPRILDLCAAPGGKSILISTFLKQGGLLVSNEVIRQRNAVLRENLMKWGAANVIVTSSDAERFSNLDSFFDCIVVDAPCSGEGMFRKDPNARKEWSPENVALCSARQKRIVAEVTKALRPGGVLIYSTCTFAPEENEMNLQQWLADGDFESIRLNLKEDWKISELDSEGTFGYRFLPNRVKGEGFFIAALKKHAMPTYGKQIRSKTIFESLSKKEIAQIPAYITHEEHTLVRAHDASVFACPVDSDTLNELAAHVYVTMPGTELGKIMNSDFVPAQALATSQLLKKTEDRIELDEASALEYLRGEAIAIDGPPGWKIVLYQHAPLGWVKVLKGRVNNYYPREWRIRMK